MLNKQEILDLKNLFLEACQINNPSRGEEEIAIWSKGKLSTFSKKPFIDIHNNVFTTLKGSEEYLLLNAHIDCVQPCIDVDPGFDGKNFYSKANTILGGDNLAGVVSILSAIKYLKKHKIKHKTLEILLTTMEEIGGVGIKNFDFSRVKSKFGLVPDSLAKVGTIIVKSPCKYNFSIYFEGIPVHGKGAAKGVSAIQIMADLLSNLELGRIKENVTLNIGTIQGGKSLNTVPGEASIKGSFKILSEGEIRAERQGEAQEVIDYIYKKIKESKSKYPKGDIIFDYELNRPGYIFNKHDEFIKKAKRYVQEAGITSKLEDSFGVSDANTLNAMGIHSLLLGTGVKNAHTTNETVSLDEIVKLTEIIINSCRI